MPSVRNEAGMKHTSPSGWQTLACLSSVGDLNNVLSISGGPNLGGRLPLPLAADMQPVGVLRDVYSLVCGW